MAVVLPGGIVLYAKLGAGYYPIACSKDVTLTTESGTIEVAPKTNGLWRTYEYERMSGSITGSGLVQIVADAGKYTALDLQSYQLSQTPVLVKFQMTDGTNTSVFEAQCLVENLSITGSASAPGTFNYTLKLGGAFTQSQTPTQGGTVVDSWDYEATGGETTIGDGSLVGVDVLDVRRNGIGLQVIVSGTPNNNQVKFTSGSGQLEFGYALGADEYILVIYVS